MFLKWLNFRDWKKILLPTESTKYFFLPGNLHFQSRLRVTRWLHPKTVIPSHHTNVWKSLWYRPVKKCWNPFNILHLIKWYSSAILMIYNISRKKGHNCNYQNYFFVKLSMKTVGLFFLIHHHHPSVPTPTWSDPIKIGVTEDAPSWSLI